MKKEIKVGTVSWIEDQPNPVYTALQATTLTPDWIPKTYLGLSATSNTPPPDPLSDFPKYQSEKNFRAMTYCHFSIEIEEKTNRVTGFDVIRAFHDQGWTPPFRRRAWPSTYLKFWDDALSDPHAYQGEASNLSVVATQNRHSNSTIPAVPDGETVLVNALAKVRAGKHTDEVGINIGSPYHVPWVWCELLLTVKDGQFKMYGNASIFPTHAWYFNDKQVKLQPRVSDATFPCTLDKMQSDLMKGPPSQAASDLLLATVAANTKIVERSLNLYPVLFVGAPTPGKQDELTDETGRKGPVDKHLHTVKAAGIWSSAV
jgi:hypothetical protein